MEVLFSRDRYGIRVHRDINTIGLIRLVDSKHFVFFPANTAYLQDFEMKAILGELTRLNQKEFDESILVNQEV